ncbi:MAG: hypothetical protein AB1609_13800 [Bacillota bacterium]
MRKSLLFAVMAVVLVAAPALASVTFGGTINYSLSGGVGITNDFDAAEDVSWEPAAAPGYTLLISFAGGEEGKWSLYGEIAPSDLTAPSKVKVVLTPPEFTLTAVQKTALADVTDPLGLLALGTLDGTSGVRIESKILGPTLVTQFENNKKHVGVKAETALGPATVGAVTKLPIPDGTGLDVVGYAKVTVAPLTVTGAFGQDAAKKTAFAGRVDLKPIPGLAANASYKKDFSENTTISGGSTYDIDLAQPGVSVSQTTDAAGTVTARTVAGAVKYRGSADNPAFADLFNDLVKKWYDYVAPAAVVSVSQAADITPNATLTLSGKLAYPVMSGVAARLFVTYEADQDGKFDAFKEDKYATDGGVEEYGYVAAKSHMLIDSELRYKLTDSLTFGPTFKFHSWSDLSLEQTDGTTVKATYDVSGGSGMEIGAKVTYAVTDNASLSLSFGRNSRSFTVTGAPAGAKTSWSDMSYKLVASVGF